jgi:predicted nucleic acid-binding protein
MLKVVLDTNIIISAAHNPVGKPALVLAIALSEEPALVSLYLSREVWQEYKEVITETNLNTSIRPM